MVVAPETREPPDSASPDQLKRGNFVARIRTVKPDLFRHRGLFDLEKESKLPIRIAFAGLFTVADREGRFRWKPDEIKLDVLPWDTLDFQRVLDALESRGFIVKYQFDGRIYGCIPTFRLHQVVNNKEKASELPSPQDSIILSTREPRDEDAWQTPLFPDQGEGKGREGKRKGKGREDLKPEAVTRALPEADLKIVETLVTREVTQEQLDSWVTAFPNRTWIVQEIRKALVWEAANPERRKQRFGAFLSRWLTKGWDGRKLDPQGQARPSFAELQKQQQGHEEGQP